MDFLYISYGTGDRMIKLLFISSCKFVLTFSHSPLLFSFRFGKRNIPVYQHRSGEVGSVIIKVSAIVSLWSSIKSILSGSRETRHIRRHSKTYIWALVLRPDQFENNIVLLPQHHTYIISAFAEGETPMLKLWIYMKHWEPPPPPSRSLF